MAIHSTLSINPTGNVFSSVQYNKGGGVQSTTLTFDTVDQYAGVELDRTTYPQGASSTLCNILTYG